MKPTFLLALVLALGMAGCRSGGSTQGASGRSPIVGIVFDKYGLSDRSINDSAEAGLLRAQKELHFVGRMVDSKSEADYAPNLQAMVDQGAILVIAVGKEMKGSLETIAKRNPRVKFVLVDALGTGSNIQSLVFADGDGGYIAGFVAGLMTKSNKIGFIGATETDDVRQSRVGYEAGARVANPSAQVLPAEYVGDWSTMEVGRVQAAKLYREGADVIFHDADRAGFGAISEARHLKKFIIASQSDQDFFAPKFVLVSIIKRADNAVCAAVKAAISGKFVSGSRYFDFSEEGLELSKMTNTKGVIGAKNLQKVREQLTLLREHKIQIPPATSERK